MRDLFLLLRPRWQQLRNRLKNPGKERLRLPFVLALVAALWVIIYVVFIKALAYFTAEELFGSVAALKLLSMILVTFGFVILISNIVTTFSTFFLSEDLELLVSGPVSTYALYGARFVETLVDSSWMVLIFGLPIFLAYGHVFSVGWGFYAFSLIGFFCLLVTATAIGIFVVESLVRTFPVRRLRDLFVLIGIVIFVGIYLIFRMIQPETFLNPEGFASIMDYLSIMSEPSSPLLPTSWMLEMLRPYIAGHGHESKLFYLALIVSTAAAAYRLAGHYHAAVHFMGYSRALESRGARFARSKLTTLFERALHRLFDPQTERLILKEALLMARDSGRIGQMLLLAALIVVYLYNFKVLPSLDSPMASLFLKNTVAFLNIGLAGFVLSSLGVRFLFPAVSAEGRAFWILKGSPMGLRKVLWVKFFFYLAPMIVLGLFLVIATNRLLGLGPFMSAVSGLTVLLLTIGITSLSIGMGVVHADLKEVDPNRLFTGFGALVTMVYGGLAVAAVVILEAFPVYRVVTAGYFNRPLSTPDYLIISACFAGAMGVCILLIIKPLSMGLKHIAALEI
jgi:ABC-2 type transport system permease protein